MIQEWIVLLAVFFATSSALAAPEDVVCDVRVPGYQEVPDTVIPRGLIMDIERGEVSIVVSTSTSQEAENSKPLEFLISQIRDRNMGMRAVQAIGGSDFRRPNLFEMEFVRGAVGNPYAVIRIGGAFGMREANGEYSFGKFMTYTSEKCTGLEKL